MPGVGGGEDDEDKLGGEEFNLFNLK